MREDLSAEQQISTRVATLARKTGNSHPLEEKYGQTGPPRNTDLGSGYDAGAGEVSDVESDLLQAAAGTAMPSAAADDAQRAMFALLKDLLKPRPEEEEFTQQVPESMDPSGALGSLSNVSVKKWARTVRNMTDAEGWLQRMSSE